MDVKKIYNGTLNDVLKMKCWKIEDVNKDECFILGKCYVFAMIADCLHQSLTFEDFEKRFRDRVKNSDKEKKNEI